MKIRYFVTILCLLIFTGCNAHDEIEMTSDFPVLQGPYLGQKPPGMVAEIFAPAIISTGDHEGISGFFDGGTVFIFHRLGLHDQDFVSIPNYVTELKGGVWTPPYPAPFQNSFDDDNYTVAPDDKTLYFNSNRSPHAKHESSQDYNIWTVQKIPTGWSEPAMLAPSLNTSTYGEYYPSVTKDGTLYFMSHRDDGVGGIDIYRSKLVNGEHTSAEILGQPINTVNDEMDSFIASDESYLIYSSKALGGYGEHDLFITFRRQNDSWTEPRNMGESINSSSSELRPSVTPDGKFLFFSSHRRGNGDIFWVSSAVIQDLKQSTNFR